MPQTTQDYSHNLRLIKPKLFMVTIGKRVNRIIRKKVSNILKNGLVNW